MSSFELLEHIHDEHLHGHDHQKADTGAGGKIRVFGADWCPWTRKQKEELEGANIDFEFIDCAQENGKELCGGITGFPTLCVGQDKDACTAGFKPAQDILGAARH